MYAQDRWNALYATQINRMTPAMLQEATVAISREVEDDVGCDANGDEDL